jgi:hypothetical protein
MGARFQGDIGSRAHSRFAFSRRITQRHDFGMRASYGLGVALGYDFAVIRNEDATDGGVGWAEVGGFLGLMNSHQQDGIDLR